MSQETSFRNIDKALNAYYTRLGHKYPKTNGIGLFMQYIIDEELLDPDVPIENELGDQCNPTDCAYTWMQSNFIIPIPPNINIPQHKKEIYFFYLLQYCYKHSHPPSDSYIRGNLLSQLNREQSEPEPEAAFSMASQWSLSSETSQSVGTDKKQQQREHIGYDVEGVDDTDVITINSVDENKVTRVSKDDFVPKCGYRSYLNIFIPKQLTMTLYGMIKEKFVDNAGLYYYIDISVGLQMDDGQMKVFKLLIDNQEYMVSVVNCDLHIKGTTHELFGIVVPNKGHFDEQGKWEWKFSEFLTTQQILLKYGIKPNELPVSSRKMPIFVQQLRQNIVINEDLIDETKWFNVPQIKSAKKNGKKQVANITITLSKEMWIKECKKGFENMDFPLIPIVVHKQNKHWIEWIKIIHIASQNIYVGVACKYMEEGGVWRVVSICLDAGDIYNKHRLVGLYNERYIKQLKHFQTSVTKIIFSDQRNKMEEKVSSLKHQIKCQRDSISRLKGCILKINNGDNEEKKKDDDQPVLEEAIKSFIEEEEIDNSDEDDDDIFFERIVDDVIKKYDVLMFRTQIIGAKSNIYIDKQFIKSWINFVTPRFNDEAMMYYWLDYTISMQMIQGYSRQYVDKENRQFMVAIINSELMDKNGEILYGIIMWNNNNNNGGKYRYKLSMLMTKEAIYKEYGINRYDLPKKSRKHCNFVSDLLLPRKIMDVDVKQINWSNVKLFKSRSNGNNDEMSKSITILPNVLGEYIMIAVDRMNMIPILSIDKNNNYYGVEWVLMVYIIHRDCYIGISFKYDGNNNLFVVKGIYLDNTEIVIKHKLVGLAYNYTQNMSSFSMKRFKIKAPKRNDAEIIMDYKRKIENEKLKNRELKQAMNNQKQVQMQHIQYLRQQTQQRMHYQYQK